MCAMEPDDLYGLPLDRFVPERGALAKALRADGQRDEAARVAALRKPSVAAWAVNQLARTQRAAMRELLAAGDELRGAQEALLAGRGDARKLRAAGERERDAVDELVGAARGLLSSAGEELSAATAERVAETLHAAALQPDAREVVSEGRLERELRHVGLGLGLGEDELGAAPAKPAAPRAKDDARSTPAGRRATTAGREQRAAAARAERERVATDRAEAERAERERAAARKAARGEERDARRRAERAARGLQAAQERRDKAAAALTDADEALAAAEAEAEAAVREHDAAQAALERAQ
jgi:hypothetical protein